MATGKAWQAWMTVAVWGAGVAVCGAALEAATGDAALERRNQVALQAAPFPLAAVRLLEGPFREAQERNRQVLLQLDPDRLLHTFRLTAGLPTTARPYGGWEAPGGELRGHSLGHYLTACALTHAATGDAELLRRTGYMVAELAKCQAALPAKGCREGFLSAYPEEFFDRVYARQRVWAPFYTLHKIMAGLLDAHLYTGNAQALDVLVKLAGWVKTRADLAGPAAQQAMLDAEFGGMNEVLANLYAVTGNPDHLALARAFDHRKVFGPLAAGEDRLDGLHANTQIPKFIGAAREYELTGEEASRRIARTAWERVALQRSYVIGGHSDREHFFPTNQFAAHLSAETCETCNTYNMLKLTRHLFAWEPDARTMDFYERALVNHVLASQDPKTGMYVYLMSLKPGHYKNYSLLEDSFWCCVGTGMENPARYGEAIYARAADALYVNLYVASEMRWNERGLTVRQETRFPEEETVRLTLQGAQPAALALKLRWPAWTVTAPEVSVNGARQPVEGRPGSYITLARTWQPGDRVDIRLPMSLRTESLPGAPEWVAFLYGPMVLAGELGTNDMPNVYVHGQCDQVRLPTPEAPVLVGTAAELPKRVEPAGAPLAFRTKGLARPADVTLVPFHRLHHQRYTVYWRTCDPATWLREEAERAAAARERQALAARIVDEFHPGEQQSETDHALQGERTRSGEYRQRKWRDADDGGWFAFKLKVDPGQPAVLRCAYWGGESGNRVFDILVEGEKLATQTLANNKPGAFFEVEHAIPPRLTEGKANVTVRFAAHPGATAGGLFGARLLRAAGTP